MYDTYIVISSTPFQFNIYIGYTSIIIYYYVLNVCTENLKHNIMLYDCKCNAEGLEKNAICISMLPSKLHNCTWTHIIQIKALKYSYHKVITYNDLWTHAFTHYKKMACEVWQKRNDLHVSRSFAALLKYLYRNCYKQHTTRYVK